MAVRPQISAGVIVLAALLAGSGRTEPAVEPEGATESPPASEPSADAPPADEGQDGAFTFPPEVEALLNQSADPEAYTEIERCITTRDIRRTEILDQQHLVFELYGKRFFLVQFPRICFGLRRGATIIYETRTGQLCRLDQIRAYDPGMGPPSPPCVLPGFMPVEPEQIALLKESLKAQRGKSRDGGKAEGAQSPPASEDAGEPESNEDG